MPHQFIHGAHTQLCHIFPQFLRDKFHKVFHIFWFAPESLPQFRILGSHTYRTGIQIADPHHHTAHCHKRRRCKTELLRAQNRRNGDVPAAHQLPVRLDPHLVSQSVLDQRLMCLRKSQLPGQSRVVDRSSGRRPRSSVITGYQDHLRSRFCHTRRHGTNTRLRYQFYGDPCLPVGIFQIIDQLCQIFYGINIMMGRRRDQAHAGRGMPCLRDPGIYLAPRQMAAFTGLCPLRHLDLNFLCTDQVTAGHAETPGSHLLDSGTLIFAAPAGSKPLFLLTAFTGIGFSVQMIHRHRQCFMGLLRDGTVGHGACLEPCDDLFHALHLGKRHRLFHIVKFHQPTEISHRLFIIHHRRVLFK